MATKKYIVLLQNNTKSIVNKVQKELSIQLTSSVELNSKVRAHDIFSAGNGIHFKNLGVAVVNDIEKAKLDQALASSKIPVAFWEEEKTFRPVSELEILKELKVNVALIQKQLKLLEKNIKAKEKHIAIAATQYTWGLKKMGIDKSSLTGKCVSVCILDTGFYIDHPDFAGRAIIGKSFVEGEAWDHDGNGHGTHCAGVAVGNMSLKDGKRYGVAKAADIVIGKVLSDKGNAKSSGIIDALDWAIEKNFKVISLSLGSPSRIGEKPSPIFERIGKKALANNSLIIAAAGNASKRPKLPKPVCIPANAKSIMAVAALDKKLKVTTFSNGGLNARDGGDIDVAAPGVDVFSSFSKNASRGTLYKSLKGTSMAVPYVAGLAALYWQAHPKATAKEIWTMLEKNATKQKGQLLRDVGKGLVQVV